MPIFLMGIYLTPKSIIQPRDLKSRTEDKAQAHEKAQKFEIAALFPDRKIERSDIEKS